MTATTRDRPQTLTLTASVKAEKPAEKPATKVRSISSSIKNLARQWEVVAASGGASKAADGKKPSKHILHAAVQINGQKVAGRSPATVTTAIKPAAKTSQTEPTTTEKHENGGKKVSPRVSPMDDKQMDDLLLSLNSLASSGPSLAKKSAAGNNQNPMYRSNAVQSPSQGPKSRLFGGLVPSRPNVAMNVWWFFWRFFFNAFFRVEKEENFCEFFSDFGPASHSGLFFRWEIWGFVSQQSLESKIFSLWMNTNFSARSHVPPPVRSLRSRLFHPADVSGSAEQ